MDTLLSILWWLWFIAAGGFLIVALLGCVVAAFSYLLADVFGLERFRL